MRYFIVRYIKQPNGQIDEIVEISKKIRPRDVSYAAVILDFQTGRVEKAHLEGVTLPRDFQRIRNYYHDHYGRIITDLEAVHKPVESLTTNDTIPR